jgi:hypothetical protein
MKTFVKEASNSKRDDEWTPVSITFGAVTFETMQPPERVLRANIKAGQEALRRAKKAIISPGVVLQRIKGVPLYYGCDTDPRLIIQELDGKKLLGMFSGGRFRVVDHDITESLPIRTSIDA